MRTIRRVGPRKYSIFICHRYKDNDLYDRLRSALRTPNFRYQNLSIQNDMLLSLRTKAGLKRSITARVRRADVMLVFAHSAGKWIAHELEAARRYNVPLISILDPQRLATSTTRARTEQITAHRTCEVPLDDAKAIVAAIRRHARPQRPAVPLERIHAPDAPRTSHPESTHEAVTTPADVARRMSARPERRGIMALLGMLFRRRASEQENRPS